MVVADFQKGQWGEMAIGPVEAFQMHPATHVFHYGQAVFEGFKAYRLQDGSLNLFRIKDNISRLNQSARRLAIPQLDVDKVYEAIVQWMDMERKWVPAETQGSLYIRPFIIATSKTLRAVPSDQYRFCVIASPVGFYYPRPIKVRVETQYSRAAKGGVGFAKAAGNYAAAFMPSKLAKEEGFDQLVWTDQSEFHHLEELGSANLFLIADNVVYTPAKRDSILAGITRDSVIQLLRDKGMSVEEFSIPLDFLRQKLEEGRMQSIFATGTAAAITYINDIQIGDQSWQLASDENQLLMEIKKDLDDHKFARTADPYNWNCII